MRADIGIIGGGISGLTTGVLLNLLGYRTEIIAEHIPTQQTAGEASNPFLASAHAAASVIPRSVMAAGLDDLFATSFGFFELFASSGIFGVRPQRHFEVSEERREIPSYLAEVKNVELIPLRGGAGPMIPRRAKAQEIYGWSYETFFVEMPLYLSRLAELYLQSGGKIIRNKLRRQEFLELPYSLLINCAGVGALELVDDKVYSEFIRGHLVKAAVPFLPRVSNGQVFSYSYYPHRSDFQNADGTARDLYFYPRLDGWILGGTREHGPVIKGENWVGDRTPDKLETIGELEVPTSIVDVHSELLARLTGVSLRDYELTAKFGYRFSRSPLRIDSSVEDGKPVVHNYGHGGAGVTLSWGSAVEVAGIVNNLGHARRSPRDTLSSWCNDDFASRTLINQLENFVSGA